MIPNALRRKWKLHSVVNCFQNCIFTYMSNPIHDNLTVVNCFQNCIFTYDSQQVFRPDHLLLVVNCFQNCIFTYDSQRHWISFKFRIRCELLSELYFYLWFPTLIDLKIWRSGCELLSELYFYLWFPTNTILLDF